MRPLTKLYFILSSILLVVSLLLTSVFYVSFNLDFYHREYTKLNTSESLKMDYVELIRVTDHMLNYLRGDRESLHIEAVVDEQNVPFFNEKEIAHMEDVLALANAAHLLQSLGLLIGIVSIALRIVWVGKRGIIGIFSSLIIGQGIVVLFGGAIGMLMATGNFDRFWTAFHQVLFTNELWLLNPQTDRLINMVPETFFFDLCKQILIIYVVIMLVLGLICAVGLVFSKRIQKNKRKEV